MDDRNKAASDLKAAEKVASEEIPEQAEDSTSGALENEEKARGFYSGNGKNKGLFKKEDKKKEGKFSAKKLLKRKGPMGLILGLLVGTGGMMMGMQSMLPVAIEEMIIEKLNSVGISSTIASDSWLDTQLGFGIRSGDIQGNDYSDMNLFGFSQWQVQSLQKQGFEVVTAKVEQKSIMAILFEEDSGWTPVIASGFLQEYSSDVLRNAVQNVSTNSPINAPISPATAFLNNDFKVPYTTASKTWRGGASGWFDGIMSQVTETKLSIKRNRWARYIKKGIKDLDANFKKIAAGKAVNDGGIGGIDDVADRGDKVSDTDFLYDKDGLEYNSDTKKDDPVLVAEEAPQSSVDVDDGSKLDVDAETSVSNATTSKDTIANVLSSKAYKTAAALGHAASYVCSIAEAIMSIYTISEAYNAAALLNQLSGFLESVDKMKAGKGGESPMSNYAETYTAKADTVYQNTGEVVRKDKTAMESSGMTWLFNNTEINNGDASVLNVNFQSIMSNASSIVSSIAMTAETFKDCGYVQVASSVLDLGSTILTFVPVVGHGIKLTQLIFKELKDIAIQFVVAEAISMFVPAVVGGIANYIIRDVATEWLGEDLGNATASAANRLLAGNGTSGGQSPASKSAVLAYMKERDNVILAEAEYQRAIRSPFDITSPYTFLGSMAYAMIPVAFSGGGIMSSLKQTSSMVFSTLSKILPTASAISETAAVASEGNCELLKAVGVMGDAYCNPYVITDVSTINTSPVAVNKIVMNGGETVVASTNDSTTLEGHVSSDNFNYSDGKIVSIKEGSDLAKYIVYCGERVSPYGIRDSAIAERVSGGGSTASIITQYIPGISDVKSIIEGFKVQDNVDWISGRACAASEENGNWNEYRWYQRFSENMRLVENMNPGYKSIVTAFLEKDYEENPVDNSFEGVLARFSGMSREKVEDTLALIEYYDYLANYDGSERVAFGEDAVKQPIENWFDNDYEIAEAHYILTNPIIYADVRNRQTSTI